MTGGTEGAKAEKRRLRAALTAARRAIPTSERAAAAASLTAAVLSLPEVGAARTVALYVSIGTEPVTTELLDVLRSRDITVLLPVVQDDLDLDWAIYAGREHLSPDGHGLLTPAGPRLGVDAVARADVLLVPAVAVGADGTRMGQGGGCYDRALARVPAGTPVVALLHEGELLAAVPAEAHDRQVTHVALPSGVRALGPAG